MGGPASTSLTDRHCQATDDNSPPSAELGHLSWLRRPNHAVPVQRRYRHPDRRRGASSQSPDLMFWLMWKRLCGSYLRLTWASRA